MCGLAGFMRAPSSQDFAGSVLAMADTLHHRGPDDGGVWTDAAAGVALGFRRLSIIDVSAAGRQPMQSACGGYVLIFNGEIYNHLSLRVDLEAAGLAPQWRGHSDTETLLAAFSAWGVKDTLRRAVGMFALALWDRAERRLTLARDRFGEKPLFYGWTRNANGNALVFGSELKSLRAYPGFANPLSRDVLALYLQFCVVPSPYSIYEDVYKLSPGGMLTLRMDGLETRSIAIESYWSVLEAARYGLANPIECESEALNSLESALREAVRLQIVADVPLGAFLSGGVDSSTIVALMQAQSTRPVQTFTIGFEQTDFDEAPHASAVARHLGVEHRTIRLTAADALAVIPKLPSLYDEPFADSSQIPTYLVCKAARQHVTVALSGDAGDELFGGYNRYLWASRLCSWIDATSPRLRRLVAEAIRAMPICGLNLLGASLPGKRRVTRLGEKAHKLAERLHRASNADCLYRSIVTDWPDWDKLVCGTGRLPTRLDGQSLVAGIVDPEHRMMLLDALTYLPDDILTKVDRAAMGVSLETRVPFLDHRVVELAWRLPLREKIREGCGKWALRQVLYRYVPRDLIERPKSGFAIPLADWLRGPLRDWAESLLDEGRLRQEGYLNAEPVRETWKQHLTGQRDWTVRIWTVLMFQAWLEANS